VEVLEGSRKMMQAISFVAIMLSDSDDDDQDEAH
jgi:hypothetical protein